MEREDGDDEVWDWGGWGWFGAFGYGAAAGADWVYGFAGESYGGAGAGGRGGGFVVDSVGAEEAAVENKQRQERNSVR